MHFVTATLEKCSYVRCITIDFSKAFDVVDRDILLGKLIKVGVNPFIIRWISNFLSNRSHSVSVNDETSESRTFNLGIVQGSAIGPSLFSAMIHDLHPISNDNTLIKFADDCSLLIPQNSSVVPSFELNNIIQWSTDNHLPINLTKTKELIFSRPSPRMSISPAPLSTIERVESFKLLGITLQSDLHFSSHVSHVIAACSQKLFLLRAL